MQFRMPPAFRNANNKQRRLYLYGVLSCFPNKEERRKSGYVAFLLREFHWITVAKSVNFEKAEQNRQRKFMCAMRTDPVVGKAMEEIENAGIDPDWDRKDPADWWKEQ